MLANFLEKSKPITFVMLLALFFCVFIFAFITNYTITFYEENPLFSYVTYALLIFSTFFFFNFIIVKNVLTFDNTYAFFFFIICLGLIPVTFLDEKMLFINLVILLFLRKVYSLKSPKKVVQKLFDGGFWLGVLFLIEPFTLIFAFLLYASIYIHQKITIQTLLVPVIAFGVPILLFFTYCFWFDKIELFNDFFHWKTPYNFSIYNTTKLMVPIVLLGLFSLVSVFLKTPKALAVKNTFRRSWILILWHFLIAIILIILIKNKNGSELIYLFFPLTVILANGLELVIKSFYKNIIISLFLIATLTVYFL